MTGTRLGGIKAAEACKVIYGDAFYRRIGHLGGSAPTSRPKGFAANRELARVAGAIGGRLSKRGPAQK